MRLLRIYKRICLILLMAMLGSFIEMGAVSAQETRQVEVWRGNWQGMPLKVTVIAVGHPIPAAVKQTQPWWQWGNTLTDAYLFSFNNEDEVDLIVVFTLEEGKPRATIYVLSAETQRRNIQISEGRIILPPDTHPYAVISPRAGDWLVNGLPNFDLDVQEIDVNGAPLWQTQVGGERPGLPKWMTRRLLQDPQPTQGYSRFGAAMREDPEAPYELATPFMPSWPYLSVVTGGLDHWGPDRPMYFIPDEHTFVMPWVGFQIAGIYNFNSLCYPPKVCFESPFVWYRFDPNAERYANVMVRGDNWPKGVPFGPAGPQFQRTTLRMTWTAEDSHLWRYSLTMTGNHPMEEQIMVGDTMLYSIPYRELLPWIAARDWRAVTFVEATKGEHGSEGIYDYSVEDNFPVAAWVNGLTGDSPGVFQAPLLKEQPTGDTSQKPEANFSAPYLRYPNIHPNRLFEGFRGEYSMAYNRAPRLYLSPIDNRVHLLYAEGGLWNLGSGAVLRMHNLNGGPHINGWTREHIPVRRSDPSDDVLVAAPGEIEEALYVLDGYLIYSGPSGVEVRQVDGALTNLDVPLPSDKANWQRFVERDAAVTAQQRDPNDLKSWVDQLPGQSMRLTKGKITGVRATADGFRFALDFPQGAATQGDNLLGGQELQAGQYAVTYSRTGGSFSVVPRTLPAFTVAPFPEGLLQESGVEVRPNTIGLRIRNTGLEDAENARVLVTAASGAEKAVEVAEQRVILLAGETTYVTIPWAPPHAGTWTINATVTLVGRGAGAKQVIARAHYEETVTVAGVSLPSFLQAASGFGLVPILAMAGLITAIVTITALGLNYLLRIQPVTETAD